MNFQICVNCGTAPGYIHKGHCPEPKYSGEPTCLHVASMHKGELICKGCQPFCGLARPRERERDEVPVPCAVCHKPAWVDIDVWAARLASDVADADD